MHPRLLSCLRRKQIIRLILSDNLGHAPFGLPVFLSAELVILQFFRDFRPDGYSAIPLSRISRIRSTAYERAYTRITAAEGLLTKCRPPRPPTVRDPSSLIPLLADLKRAALPILVNSAPTPQSNQTLLGQITALSDTTLTLRPFDATAKWLSKSRPIPLAEILDFQWQSHYLTIYQKHLPPLAP